MIDTVGLRCEIDDHIAEKIERFCTLRQGIECQSGEVLYQITTGGLDGSFDSRLSVKVDYKQWVHTDGKTQRLMTRPYLHVEGSVQKLMVGHNVYGGLPYFQLAARWLVAFLEQEVGVFLPDYRDWEVRRIDKAEVYELPSFAAVEDWFRGVNTATFPRRQALRYGTSGIYFPGRATTSKAYHKGPEFWRHDRKRLNKHLSKGELQELVEYANKLLRLEVEIKTPKLKSDFGPSPRVSQVTDEYIEHVYDAEVSKFLREGASDMETVRTALEVQKRLLAVYGKEGRNGRKLPSNLFGFWYQLSTLGEDVVKETVSRPTFYRMRKQLEDAAVSWRGTDVVLREDSQVPADFAPVRTNPARLTGLHPLVYDRLEQVLKVSRDDLAKVLSA